MGGARNETTMAHRCVGGGQEGRRLPDRRQLIPGEQPAVENKRVAARRRVLKTCYNVVRIKPPTLECPVRNHSEAGASIQVSTTIGIPSIFDVIIDGARRQCRSVWRTDSKIGIAF